MMDLDELERIATEAQRNTLTGVWEFKRDCSPETVLALVRVAKASQAVRRFELSHPEEALPSPEDEWRDAVDALAALSPDTKERTDG